MAGKENAAQSPGIAREKLRTSSSGTVSSPAPAALSTAGSDGPSAAALGGSIIQKARRGWHRAGQGRSNKDRTGQDRTG